MNAIKSLALLLAILSPLISVADEKQDQIENIKNYNGFMEEMHRSCINTRTEGKPFHEIQKDCAQFMLNLSQPVKIPPGMLLYLSTLILSTENLDLQSPDEKDRHKAIISTLMLAAELDKPGE